MSRKRVFVLAAMSIAALFAIVACSETQVPTQVPVEFHPTPGPAVDRPGEQVAPPTRAPAVPAASGDAAAGEGLFTGNGCSACHATDESQLVGPGLGNVFERAGSRTSLDAGAYLEQSIREPGVFLVEGFLPLMPVFAQFSDDDVQNLVAYLKTLN